MAPQPLRAMEIGLYIEAQEGATWRDWRSLARRAEALGFDALVCSVHLRSLQAPARDALDLWPVLTAIALWTRRLRFGPMVLPVAFYPPAQVARMAAALDHLSGGRFRLRLGAGRDAGEHHAFGLPFAEHDERVGMVGEAVQVIRLLWSGQSVSFAGRWYRLENAQLRPPPQRSWIGVGGDSEASLRVAAAHADEWCTAGSMEKLRQHLQRLDTLAHEAGRSSQVIERTLMNGVLIGRDRAELERRADRLRAQIPSVADWPPSAILQRTTEEWGWWVGTPEQVVSQVHSARRAGVDGIFFQLYDFRDWHALQLLAREVIPRVRNGR